MSQKKKKREVIKKKLLTKNRLVILNEETFEEIFSLKLTLLNVFVVATSGAIFLIAITTYIIAFTPLREYIPGYASTKLKRQATELTIKSDSLEKVIRVNNIYMESIKKVLSGEVKPAEISKDSIEAAEVLNEADLNLKPSKQDSILRKYVEAQEQIKK